MIESLIGLIGGATLILGSAAFTVALVCHVITEWARDGDDDDEL